MKAASQLPTLALGMILSFAWMAHANDGLTSQDGMSECASWYVGQHDVAEQVQLSCLLDEARSGRLASVGEAVLTSERAYYYTHVAVTGNAFDAEIIRILVNEAERRKPLRGQRSKAVFAALLMSGQVEKAEEEREAKGLDVAPIDVEGYRKGLSASPREAAFWTFKGDANQLQESFVDLTRGAHVVVYSTAGCGFCAAAANDILKDERLGKMFREKSVWMDTPDMNFSREYYDSWNARFPDFPMRAVFDRRNWPTIDVPGTPYFSFINDGRVVAQLLGWRKEDRDKFYQDLVAIGLPIAR